MLYWGISPPSLFPCSFGVQSHHTFSVTTFRVAPFQFGIQSHYVFSFMTFKVISLNLTFTTIVSAWLSEPPCLLGYDVQSILFSLTFIVWCSEPLFIFSLASEPLFHFDIQSHRIFRLAFRFVDHFSFGV